MAADYGQQQVIEYLIENGADVNVRFTSVYKYEKKLFLVPFSTASVQ